VDNVRVTPTDPLSSGVESVGVEPDSETAILRQIIEATPSAMVMVDVVGQLRLVNHQAEVLFGYSHDELLAMNVELLIPERFRPSHEDSRAGFFEQPDRREMGSGRELFGRRKDGTEVPIEIGLNPIRVMGEQHVLASVIDISERLELQAIESAKSADQLRGAILASLPFSIIASAPDGTIVSANPAAARLLGFDPDELVGAPISAIRESGARGPMVTTRPDAVQEREIDYRRKDGTTVPVHEATTLMTGDGSGVSDVSGILSVAYDITQRREAEELIRHLAHHDFLTDLPNRTKLFERLDVDLRASAESGIGVAVALIDLDHFKRVNDSLGHHVGDDLLLKMSARLSNAVREDDLVARLGGDEFVVVFTGVHDQEHLQDRLVAVLAALREPLVCFSSEIIVTASMGLAMSPQDGQDATTLLKHADTAMYHAKSAARNTYRWFEESMLDETNDKLKIGAALRRAIERQELSVSYQPQISMRDGTMIGVEALARWVTPEGQFIPPDRFIPIAEDNGSIIQLGEWVLRRACQDAVRMSADTGLPLRLAVNVSPRQFQDPGWLDVLRRALDESGLPAERLELEITEGIFMEDPGEVVDIMSTVRALGVAIVMDDFGTGFSSLAYLTRFTIDKIKIDRSFVSNIAARGADAAIVNTVIVMAHALGMSVVAEGVETQDQELYLRGRGCDVGQGFRYSKAVPPSELVAHAVN
jgi:diguanylate cyclase (GGDEF)-like protein/PAS domain S-box-containing protein